MGKDYAHSFGIRAQEHQHSRTGWHVAIVRNSFQIASEPVRHFSRGLCHRVDVKETTLASHLYRKEENVHITGSMSRRKSQCWPMRAREEPQQLSIGKSRLGKLLGEFVANMPKGIPC